MQALSSMSNRCPQDDARACSRKARALSIGDRMLLGVIVWTLVHTTEALAGEQNPVGSADTNTNPHVPRAVPGQTFLPVTTAMFRIPAPYQPLELPETKTFSAQEFRPRGRSIFDNDTLAGGSTDQPLMNNTTVWQRLGEYRNHDRISLVTLWETGGSSLSLQAGRKGDPTLQWTSRLMGHGGTRGLLDELFSTSVGGVGRNLHWSPRASSSEPAAKASKSLDVGIGNIAGTK